ncbi:hypothetical protein BGL_1c36090 [Burkholderia plantarii]|uniref:Uncharacterized protein n=1 Tax=Burkholderia plantarii TaxID=41899 RepID=A0A0B6S754_BURPL|nr:hypothetical protein BGL_1c36090 [Burkholderia plantarii]
MALRQPHFISTGKDAPQRGYDLRELFNVRRGMARARLMAHGMPPGRGNERAAEATPAQRRWRRGDRWSMVCVRCRAWRRSAGAGPARTFSMAARDEGMDLQVIALLEAKQGFVALARRRLVEASPA